MKFLFNGKNGIFGHRKEMWGWEENFSPMMCTTSIHTRASHGEQFADSDIG
jgi:hypothetical protein